MPMMFAINKENFEGHREVTCCSCHHGAAKLVPMPVIGDEEKPATMAEATGAAEDESAANLPTPDEILGKYIRALSGASASGDTITAFDGKDGWLVAPGLLYATLENSQRVTVGKL